MPINIANKGSNISSYANFYNVDGTPFQPSESVKWVVRDFDSNQIASGTALQNIKIPAQWVCNFTLPLTVPSTNNNAYSLTWFATNGNNTQTASEYFSVQDVLEQPPYETAQVALLGMPFEASLWCPINPSTISLRICDEKGTVRYVQIGLENFKITQANNGWVVDISVNPSTTGANPPLGPQLNLAASSAGVTSLFLYWNYTDQNANQETIVNRLYTVNGTMIRLMDDLRRFLDRIRNEATIPQLRLSDVDLAHFALQGMDKFNGTPPVNNGTWGLGNLPPPFYESVKIAACIRFLQAQFLATGYASFDFNGQAVSLSQNQSQYLEALSSTLTAEYETTATTNKKAMIRSSSFASIGGYFGPTSLLIGRVPYGFSTFFTPTLPFLG